MKTRLGSAHAASRCGDDGKDDESSLISKVEKRKQRSSGTTNLNQQDGKALSGFQHDQDQKWNARYRELEAFRAEHGHCNVSQGQGSLGTWVHEQRRRKKGNMAKERLRKLDDLGFNWGGTRIARRPPAPPVMWDERFDDLTKYKAEHGHCSAPRSHGPLGRWVDKQRRRKGKMSKERIQKLDDLGFVWNPRGPPPTWDERFEELLKYKSEHGDCGDAPSHGSLGAWVNSQRIARKRGKLSKESARKLDDLGFDWCNTRGPPKTWNERLDMLKNYKAEHGDCNVPQTHGALGSWLDDLGFSWRNIQNPALPWDERLEMLKEYKAEHGNCSIPQNQGPLGSWVNRQRTAFNKGKLSKERVQKLDDLGFDWGTARQPKPQDCIN